MRKDLWSWSDVTFSSGNYSQNAKTQPTTKRNIDANSEEFYPTPYWATEALLSVETFEGPVWECACGDGAISEVMVKHGYDVISSDLFDRGYGEGGVDFLTASRRCDNIVTNPPYRAASDFVLHGLAKADRKVALLLRLAFLEGAERCERIFRPSPPARVWVFSERITFYPKGAEVKGSGTTAYAWFVWDKLHSGETSLRWLKPGFKPGSRASRRIRDLPA